MSILKIPFSPDTLSSDYYRLNVSTFHDKTTIIMQLSFPVMTTASLPQTYNLLENFLPSIHVSKCFNDKHYSFRREVRSTEIGHLFEHILLEFLCKEKMSKGFEDAEFRGITHWDWNTDIRGTFHITINCGYIDAQLFPKALYKSVLLLNKILDSGKTIQ
ncbi:MAG TPA: hypothetical protein VLF68_03675 [Candidatus Saccharimonadales bacterium]|nr:hypothetical protein [Candidatus Saccharimonadales bacterium]